MTFKIFLIKLFSNYHNEKSELSFKNYVKKQIGDNWIYKISNSFALTPNEISRKIKEYSTLKDFLDFSEKWNIKLPTDDF